MADLTSYEFRTARAEEMRDFHRLVRYVFADNSTPSADEEAKDPIKPEMTTIALHRGKLVATSGGFPFRMRLNGVEVKADGVTAVGTDPGHRRRGIVRHLITQRLKLAHSEGVPASILWASMGAIYQRFGYGLASSMYSYRFDPRLAAFQFGDESPTGWVARVDREAALPIVEELYDEFHKDRNLMLYRPPIVWKEGYLEGKRKFHFAIHYDQGGTPDGYVSYRLREHTNTDDGPNQRFGIHDFIYGDMNAYRGLWHYIRSHDLVKEVHVYVPTDDPALSMLLEPRSLRARWEEGIWMRVVDVQELASQRSYQATGTASFEILEDPECPWNVGRYCIESNGIEREVTRNAKNVDFRIGINGLASLISGHTSLSGLCTAGRAEISDAGKLPSLDSFFSSRYKPFCIDDF